LGARWEGAVIGQAIYDEGTNNRKFIPVLLGKESQESILNHCGRHPLPMSG